mmetsp:Transcript_2299/g.4183  ORF Transcript_2299/g.4183 Transcript_2299/m.4183 type:complete len:251 (-) Transcript_2299:735-1487(-)|eukprot:CAMPEP_0198287820 /NCGR_PEP_ID=MMETSP1449-20131203/6515_1 /TAXON_ID=420275 /ORGANISM="Attheya septentrionalis, Strain CCMP2084" /LENGTH=250 /DNA_ID=CAMNT_0043985861 /DNA_START=488 /DNA_END=1240 /DNA_ORIENTATION=+
MGNASSRYEETNWDEASGGLESSAETVDGSEPTDRHVQIIITPTKGGIMHNLPVVRNVAPSREYEAKDADGTSIFTTKKIDALNTGFDLIDSQTNEVVLKVDSTYSNRTWHIFQVGTPVFEGQRADSEPSEKTGELLFRKASVSFGKDTQHTAEVNMFTHDDVEAVLQIERCTPPHICDKVMDQWHFQTSLLSDAGKSQLVGYWKWEGFFVLGKEKMHMDVARDADLALHVILAVIATIERFSVKAEYTG